VAVDTVRTRHDALEGLFFAAQGGQGEGLVQREQFGAQQIAQ
jgi:hypothetical protein